MLTKEQLHNQIAAGLRYLDGATGSNLQKMGMPKGCCTELWVLEHPDALIKLQQQYARSGCQILYAPTFQAQPIALKRVGLAEQTESINGKLVQISRQAAPQCLIAGDLTTLAAFTDSWDPEKFDLLVDNYRRQIRGLMDGGVDLLVAETLMYPQEAEAILTAAELEQAGAVMYSFVLTPDGSFFSGSDAGPTLRELEQAGAAAVGFNCVAADRMTPYLVSKLRRYVKGPLMCKPNAGIPTISQDGIVNYTMNAGDFADIQRQCLENGATLLGGCCGTNPEFMKRMIDTLGK